MRRYHLEFTAFIAGGAIMVLELTGSRVLAPHTGLAVNVWTVLIGTILSALAAGYWYGGRLADRSPTWRTLSWLLAFAAVGIALSGIFRDVLLASLVEIIRSYVAAAFWGTCILFVPASFCLAAIGPVAARLSIHSLESSGKAIGRVSAFSTAGSIAGTFLTGLYLFEHFGTTWILAGISGILFLLAAVLYPRKYFIPIGAILILILSGPLISRALLSGISGLVLVDIDTAYQRVLVVSSQDALTGRPIREMITDNLGVQSAVFSDQDDDLVPTYLKFFRIADYFVPEQKNMLLIGGGAYTYPRDWLKRHPQGVVDVVEIDSGLLDISKKYFGLTDDPRMRVHHEDGRTFLNRASPGSYDVILIDAFRQLTPPFELTTREAIQKMRNALRPGGVVLANIVSAIDGPRGKFLRAEVATFKTSFKVIELYPMSGDPKLITNTMLVARTGQEWGGKTASPELEKYLSRLRTEPVAEDVPILTDEFAPVDQYLAAAVDR